MYNKLSFYGKLVSFILLVIAMIIINNYNIFLLICGMIFILSYINKEKKYFVFCFVLFLLTFILNYNFITFIILRIVLVIVYGLIIESSLLSLEKRFLYDKLFYRNSSSKKLKNYIKRYYYKDIVNDIKLNNKRINKYLNDPDKYSNYLDDQTKKKASLEINNKYIMDRLRFDRIYSSKRNILAFSWNNYDNLYLAVTLILFIIVLGFGR